MHLPVFITKFHAKDRCSPSHPSNAGFTVIEMLVALALSSMLIIGLMSIVKLFGSYQAALSSDLKQNVWQTRLQDQIRTDIINSREYRVTFKKLELIGYASKNFVTGKSELLPSNITYQIENFTEEKSCLIRSETHHASSGRVVWESELMATGFASIQFERTEDWVSGGLGLVRQSQNAANSSGQLPFARISDRMTLMFYADDSSVDAKDWIIPLILR